jgi:hypothetical protein
MTISELVQRARALAREAVLEHGGLDSDAFTVQELVGELLGDDDYGPKNLDGTDIHIYLESLEAAYAVGIAVGLLLRPDVFAQEPRRRSRVRRPRLIATIGPAEPAEGGAR